MKLDAYNYPLDMSKFDNTIQHWMFEALMDAMLAIIPEDIP